MCFVTLLSPGVQAAFSSVVAIIAKAAPYLMLMLFYGTMSKAGAKCNKACPNSICRL